MKEIVILSPHLDDAVLSCGGFMAEMAAKGERVVVYNLFCAPYNGPLSPAAQELHASWGNVTDITRLRLEEDERALKVLGAERVIGDIRDLIYRQDKRGKWLYRSMEDIQGERNPEDDALVEHYFTKINEIFPKNEVSLYAPLGIGGHIDHVIAFDIGMKLKAVGYEVGFYEDLPYALKVDWVDARMMNLKNMKVEVKLSSLESLEKKIEALRCYASQISLLFENEENMELWLTAHAHRMSAREDMGGEKVWRFG